MVPYGSPEDIGVIQLAWLGDSVWELHQRLRHVHFPLKSKDLHLSVVNEVKANIIVFTFKGQLDAFSEKQFKNFVINNLKNEFSFVIDLTKIDFLDSSGLVALEQTAKECKKLKLRLSVVGNSRVAQTIKLVRLGDFLNLKLSLEEALNYLKN